MQCNELESALANDDLNVLSAEARQHLAGCPSCRDMVGDFSAILSAAHRLPKEVNPPERLWVSLRAQLEAEGIIREPETAGVTMAAPWWQGFQSFFRPRVLASVAGVLAVVVGGLYFVPRTGIQSGKGNPPANISKVDAVPTGRTVEAAVATPAPAVTPGPHTSTHPSSRVMTPPAPRESKGELAPSPSQELAGFAESAAVLSETEHTLPARRLARNAMVDAALRQNLHTLNEFIAECEARLRQNPQDQLTREYLNMAYQQKAELLTAMMDSGRSEQ